MTDIYSKMKRVIHVQVHILFGQHIQNNTQTQSKDFENNKQTKKKSNSQCTVAHTNFPSAYQIELNSIYF